MFISKKAPAMTDLTTYSMICHRLQASSNPPPRMVISECDPEKESDENGCDNGPFDNVCRLREGLAPPYHPSSRSTYWRVPPPHAICLAGRPIRWNRGNELPLDDHLGVYRNAFESGNDPGGCENKSMRKNWKISQERGRSRQFSLPQV